MNSYSYFLSEYDLINLNKSIQMLKNESKATVACGDSSYLLFSNNTPIPSKMELNVSISEEDSMAITIAEVTDKEYRFYLAKYKMKCQLSGKDIRKMRGILHAMVDYMKTAMPAGFVSMEHVTAFLGDSVEVHVTTLQKNLLVTGKNAVESVFAGFHRRGEVRYHNNHDRVPERIRLEVRENEFRYVAINMYTIYEKDGAVFAAGIVRCCDIPGRDVFSITVITKNDNSHRIAELFDDRFEDSLLGNSDISGGKFTGDQKIIKLKEKLTFADIALEASIKDKVRREIFDFFKVKDLYKKANLPFKRGVALYGPPGTGKTMIAKIIASTMKETVIWVKAGDIATADDINRVFRLARMGAPSVVILEDIDFYTEDRSSGSPSKIGIATLMSNLDGLEENDGILVVVTTNRIDLIEKAIIDRPGRIDSRIFIGELGRDSIAYLLEKKLGKFKRNFRSFLDVVPAHTVMTGALVVELSTSIMRQVLKNSSAVTSDIVIKDADVQKAMKEMVRLENRSKTGFAAAV